jgi:ParB family chromosome partitioning protein
MNDKSDLVLFKIDAAQTILAEVRTIDDAKRVIAMADAATVFAKRVHASQEVTNSAAEIRLRAERMLGEILEKTEKNKGAKGDPVLAKRGSKKEPRSDAPPTLAEVGIDKKLSSRAQKLAAVPQDKFDEAIERGKSDELNVRQFAQSLIDPAHVSHNSGENEWYTPQEYIDAATATMGRIELDPASTATANQVVKAVKFYTESDDGLSKRWRGNVFLNPPYAQPTVGQFAEKLVASFNDNDIEQACVLVNNATETKFFQLMASVASAVCFPAGRVKFWHPSRESAPLQGQAVLYFGENPKKFRINFSDFGFCAEIFR